MPTHHRSAVRLLVRCSLAAGLAVSTQLVGPVAGAAAGTDGSSSGPGDTPADGAELVSVTRDGDPSGSGFIPVIGGRGRDIGFVSTNRRLLEDETTGGEGHVFVRDLDRGETTLVDRRADGGTGGRSGGLALDVSHSGRLVAFSSSAIGLVDGVKDRNRVEDVFVRDVQTDETWLVSEHYAGGGRTAYGRSTVAPGAFSKDGRTLVFESRADDLVKDDWHSDHDVFVRDLATGKTTLVSRDRSGIASGGFDPVISANGRWVAFASDATGLVPDDDNDATDVFRLNVATGRVTLISRTPGGAPADAASEKPAISGDGKVITYVSEASDLVVRVRDRDGDFDIFAWDAGSGQSVLVTQTPAGDYASGGDTLLDERPDISADGRWVVFASAFDDLLPGDTNGRPDVFVFDLSTRVNHLVSTAADGGFTDGTSSRPSISSDGASVAFSSDATDLDTSAAAVDAYVTSNPGMATG